MLWLAVAVMTAAAAGALLIPLWRARGTAAPRAAYDLEIYRDQLTELEREQARGLIGNDEAKAARTEIARRALAADTAARTAAPATAARRNTVFAIIAGLAPITALGLYLVTGSPHLPGVPFASRVAPMSQEDAMVAQLAERLKGRPDDLQGWTLLARSYNSLGRMTEAVAAWRQVMRISNNDPEYASPYAEALVQTANGIVTPEAASHFEAALKADPGDPRAMFFLGLAREQAGEPREALQRWVDLLLLSPQDAPWVPMVQDRLRRLAADAKIDPATLAPSEQARALAQQMPQQPPMRGPSAADVDAAQSMSPEDRQTMIRGMVDTLAARLEANPNDLDGWRRLARARRVLGDNDKALEALARAAALAPQELEVQTDYASALFERLPRGEKLPPEFVRVMRNVLALDANHGDALWFVGVAEMEAGNRAAALDLWQHLVNRLPPQSDERREVQGQIDRLKAAR
jgi:cytochrome c-type biogenesis protein CcmH